MTEEKTITNCRGLPIRNGGETSAEYLQRLDSWYAEVWPAPTGPKLPKTHRQRERIGREIESLRLALRRGKAKHFHTDPGWGVASASAMKARADREWSDTIAEAKHRREHPPSMLETITQGMHGRDLEIAREVFADVDDAPSKPVAGVGPDGRTVVDHETLAREAKKAKTRR